MEIVNEALGFLYGMPTWGVAAGIALAALVLGFAGAPLWLWAIGGYSLLLGFDAPTWSIITYTAFVVLFNVVPLRRALVSNGLMKLLDALNFLPKISETEQTAIEAGTVWVDGELFSGKPDFKRLLNENYPKLSDKERAFIDGPVEELCRMVDDWDVWQKKGFDNRVWDFLKREKFLGLIIPEEYGGLNFSANAHSAIVGKLSSRCGPLATTVMVPNSLGPAELLIHYGTEEQKNHFLASQLGVEVATPRQYATADLSVVGMIPEHLARAHLCIALDRSDEELIVAMVDVLDLRLLDSLREFGEGIFAGLAQDFAVGRAARVDFQAPRRVHRRSHRRLFEAVEILAVLARQLQHVGEPGAGHERDLRTLAFEHRVGAHRRAVDEVHARVGKAHRFQSLGNGAGRIVGGREHLGRDELAVDQRDEVGERASDVDPDFWGSRILEALGTRAAESAGYGESDLLSYLLFDGGYTSQLLKLGYRDAKARHDDLIDFFAQP